VVHCKYYTGEESGWEKKGMIYKAIGDRGKMNLWFFLAELKIKNR